MKNVLVVPTIRQDCITRFLNSWKDEPWNAIVIVEDNPEKTFDIDGSLNHYSWKEITEEFGEDAWIFSKRDSAIRSFGFYKAWQIGAEVTYTLDDDCYSLEPNYFVSSHLKQLEQQPRWTESILGMRTRGLPYRNLGVQKSVVNMGFWTNVPDLDGVQGLTNPLENWKPPPNCARIIPNGQYFPLCGMNVAFTREVAPLFYFPLMGQSQPFARFDDIWAGIILKKICDHLHLNISVGPPHVKHLRASNPFVNLVKEAPGISYNESFWQQVDEIPLWEQTPLECMLELGNGLIDKTDDYLKKLGTAIGLWGKRFRE